MVKIAVIGTGYVGLVSGTCLAEIGHQVVCCDNDSQKIMTLKEGKIPIYEPGLEEMIRHNVMMKRLSFTTSIEEATKESLVIFIAVGTPPKENGEADLSYVEAVSREIGQAMDGYRVIVEKSTVPVKTGQWIKRTIEADNIHSHPFDVVSNPEFLREGSAIEDFMYPDRVVLGVESERAKQIMVEVYEPLNAPLVITSLESAELIKHASNSFLSLKISFINAISRICELVGADVEVVAKGMGLDKRIGPDFLRAGCGYGGFCFPKDLLAFIKIAEEVGYDFKLLKEVQEINEAQKMAVVRKTEELLWNLNNKTIGILGLAFKPNTDDMREAPSITIIKGLQSEGVKIKAYDPVAMPRAKEVLEDVIYGNDPYEVAEGSDCLILLTEWPQFKDLDLLKIKELLSRPNIVDGRNIYQPEEMRKLGFNYKSIGRP
ncbi:TPA: UDP-glucose 6-dehydrogenase [bacterium]|nr:UDP-glucose 6-dehydrogenase [bacterium]